MRVGEFDRWIEGDRPVKRTRGTAQIWRGAQRDAGRGVLDIGLGVSGASWLERRRSCGGSEESRSGRWGRGEKWKRAKKEEEKEKTGMLRGEKEKEEEEGPSRTGPVYLVRHTLSDLWRPIRQRFSSWPHTHRGLPIWPNENRLLSKYRGCVVCGVLASLKPISGRPIFMQRGLGSIPPFSCIYRRRGERRRRRERIAWVKEESCSSSQVLEMFDLRLESIGRLNEDSDGGQKIIFTELFIVKISGEIWFRTWIYITGFSFFFFYVQANVNHELNMRQRTQHSYVVFGILITLANQ